MPLVRHAGPDEVVQKSPLVGDDGAVPGGKLEVFVYRDSEDRLVATTEKPYAVVGEFACLKVVGVNPRIGVFLDRRFSPAMATCQAVNDRVKSLAERY